MLFFLWYCSGSKTGCVPETKKCEEGKVLMCLPDGKDFIVIQTCRKNEVCIDGECIRLELNGKDTKVGDASIFDIKDSFENEISDIHDTYEEEESDIVETVGEDDVKDIYGVEEITNNVKETLINDVFEEEEEKCGNGMLDPGEKCDPGITAGQGACPTSCPPQQGCIKYELVGSLSDCSRECKKFVINALINNDGCCPDGANSLVDTDCEPQCGNGILENGEECEANIMNKDCSDFGFDSGELKCVNCKFDTALCKKNSGGDVIFSYKWVKNTEFKGDFKVLSHHRSGNFALIVTGGFQLLRYTYHESHGLPGTLTLEKNYSGTVLSYVACSPTDDICIVIGNDKTTSSPAAFVYNPVSGEEQKINITVSEAKKLMSVKFKSNGKEAMITATNGDSINYLFLLKSSSWTTVSDLKAFSSLAGIFDGMWWENSSYSEDIFITCEGINWTDSHIYFESTGEVSSANLPGGYGNLGRCNFRPQGEFGYIAPGYASTGKLYSYGKTGWKMITFPFTTSGIYSVKFDKIGQFALVVGRSVANGNDVLGKVYLLTITGDKPTDFTVTKQMITGFGNPPYNADTNTYLYDGEIRPDSPCLEGIVCGSHNGSQFNPGFGTLVYFYDLNNIKCTKIDSSP